MWGEPAFFFLVLFSLIIDFYLAQLLYYAEGKLKNILITVAVSLNVALLVAYKYIPFLVENFNVVRAWWDAPPWVVKIALPVGISFITFQKLSYVIDVYRNTTRPQEDFVKYALYILFFPQLIAGPIIRYHEVASQLSDRFAKDSIDNQLSGLFRFVIGLAKKVLIANALGEFVDEVFNAPLTDLNTPVAWLALIGYSFQIYYDFSGYSDMAIGIARMLGFRFPENFRFPYIAQSITEFWRRWHITLSQWMKDYLYIPLGGNRISPRRTYLNLWTVFLISGLWHGAAWNFLIWGAWHGLFLVADRTFLVKRLAPIGKIPRMMLTYMLVLMGWVWFRSPDLAHALGFFRELFSFNWGEVYLHADGKFMIFLALAAVGAFMGGWERIEQTVERWMEQPATLGGYSWRMAISVCLALLCIIEIYASGFNPFIYFRF